MALLVNGELVSDQEIAHHRALLFESEEEAERLAGDPRILRVAEEHAVFHAVLRQAAAASGLVIPAEQVAAEIDRQQGTGRGASCAADQRAAIERDLQVRHFIDKLTRNVARPSRREVEAVYLRNRSRYALPESLHLRHIVINVGELTTEQAARTRIEHAQAALAHGEPFAAVADRFSDCRGVGGELGWVTRGEMVEEFDEVVFALEPRVISAVFPTRFGLHLAELLQRRPARQQSFEEVRPALARDLLKQARQRVVRQALQQQFVSADVRIVHVNGGSSS